MKLVPRNQNEMRVRKYIMLRNTRGNKFARVCTFNEELFKFLNIRPGANL